MIERDTALLAKLGWNLLVKQRTRRGDLGSLDTDHHARRLLRLYKHRGAPVTLHTLPWPADKLANAIHRGPHHSALQHLDFLRTEFQDMVNKGQWLVLPYSAVKDLPGLTLSPPGVVPQRDRRPRWICDYTFSGVNDATAPIAPLSAMQFGHTLDRILREILLCNPDHGAVNLLKIDIADGFYRVHLKPDDIPKLGVVFPTRTGQEPLVALPLVLPMGWKNSPPIFCAATETAADIANTALQSTPTSRPHHLDDAAAAIPSVESLPQGPTVPSLAVPCPDTTDPHLRRHHQRSKGYVDVFIDDFIALAQGTSADKRRVRQLLMHAIDTVFRPLDAQDSPSRREPISVKKLQNGDSSWGTIKTVLGWTLDTVGSTISLPQHRQERLAEILASIPKHQKRTSIKKWHKVLGELRSMSLALPGARSLFSFMQHALGSNRDGRIALAKGVHDALDDFRWLHKSISSRPTRMQELVPLPPSISGFHDAAKTGAGGVLFPDASITSRSQDYRPILWRFQWPPDIQADLVSEDNPNGRITNSDLELAGAFLQLEAASQNFDVRERTILARTDNLPTLFWTRTGSTTTTRVPAHLLRLFGIHQRFHRYIPRHDYVPGKLNPLADDSSRMFHLTDSALLSHFNLSYPQPLSYKLWTPSQHITSAVISALRRKPCKPESLLVEPPPPTLTGPSGPSSRLNWPWMPFARPSKTKYHSSKFLASASELAAWPKTTKPSKHAPLRITYGRLAKRSEQWASWTLA